MAYFGLLHIPKAETVLVKSSREAIEAVFQKFNIYLFGDSIYKIDVKEQSRLNNTRDNSDILLIREEFEIYELTEQQINMLDKDFRAKVDALRDKGASR